MGFDGRARNLIAPTERLDAVRRVIDRAELGEGTAIGEAVFTALDEIENAAAESIDAGEGSPPGAIVLLSDGETTQGRPNDEAAAAAHERGVTVNTIAFGTDAGTIEDPASGTQVPVPVNRSALAELAQATDGAVLSAETADELRQIYEDLAEQVTVDAPRREVTDWFAGIALVLRRARRPRLPAVGGTTPLRR